MSAVALVLALLAAVMVASGLRTLFGSARLGLADLRARGDL